MSRTACSFTHTYTSTTSSLGLPPCPPKIPDDHLAGCRIHPEADSPGSIELRPDGAGLPGTDLLLYLHVKTTHKCKVEVKTRRVNDTAAESERFRYAVLFLLSSHPSSPTFWPTPPTARLTGVAARWPEWWWSAGVG